MNRSALALIVLLLVSLSIFAQTPDAAKSNGGGAAAAGSIPPAPAITDTSTPTELARAALAAQGGDKFKNLKSTWVTGDANLYAPNSSQSLPGKFSMVTAGDKIRICGDGETENICHRQAKLRRHLSAACSGYFSKPGNFGGWSAIANHKISSLLTAWTVGSSRDFLSDSVDDKNCITD